jgi:hypothetical protein
VSAFSEQSAGSSQTIGAPSNNNIVVAVRQVNDHEQAELTGVVFPKLKFATATSDTVLITPEEFNSLSPSSAAINPTLSTVGNTLLALSNVQCSYVYWRGDYRRTIWLQGFGSRELVSMEGFGAGNIVWGESARQNPSRTFRRNRRFAWNYADSDNHVHKKTGSGAFELSSRPHQINDGITWIDDRAWQLGNSQSDFWQINLFGAAGPQTFLQSFTATFSPSATLNRATSHLLTAATFSPTGALLKNTRKLLPGATLNFTGAIALAKIFIRAFTATLNLSAAFTKQPRKSFAATFSPSGVLTRFTTKSAFAATQSFVAALVKNSSRSFAATLSDSATLSRSILKSFPATLSPSATIARKTNKSLSATFSPTGVLTRNVRKILPGATLSFTGALAVSKFFVRAFTATANFTGALTRQTQKNLVATFTPTGALTRFMNKLLSAATLSFVGALTKRTNKNLSGTFSSIGALATLLIHGGQTFFQSFTATLTPGGALSLRTSKTFAATFSPTAILSKLTSKTPFTATFSPTAIFSRSIAKNFAATLSDSATFSRSILKSLSATLSPSAILTRRTSKGLTATFSPTGGLTKNVLKSAFTATLSFVGNLATQLIHGGGQLFFQAFTATLTPTASLTRKVLLSSNLAATFAPVGLLTKNIRKNLPAASLTFTGAIAKTFLFARTSFSATRSFTGALSRQTQKNFTATLSPTSALTRKLFRPLAASQTFAATLTKNIRKNLPAATVSFTGNLTSRLVHIFLVSFTATLATSATLRKTVGKNFVASLSFTTALGKLIGKNFTATLAPVGSLAVRILTGFLADIIPQLFLDSRTRSSVNMDTKTNVDLALDTKEESVNMDTKTSVDLTLDTKEESDIELEDR